ncbi:hypothetical protein TNCV_1208451 [Trichonephila clavipes]|nr:hypothetical protein TNCV_1208451 [Trichonephila clavipes]
MFDLSYFVNPTPLAHSDTSRDVLPEAYRFAVDYPKHNVITKNPGFPLIFNIRVNNEHTSYSDNSRPPQAATNSDTEVKKSGVPTKTIERKTQQEGPVQSRKGRGRNGSPHIEEQTRSSNRNAKGGGDQQRQDQERKGACTRKSLSLEVLVGNANYKS